MDKEQFLNKAGPILEKPKWIVDGNLGDHISREKIFEDADIIIILNPSYLKLIYSVITHGISKNSWIKLGTHTQENATIIGLFTYKDLILEIIGSLKIIINIKKKYIHYLVEMAQDMSYLSKINIFN